MAIALHQRHYRFGYDDGTEATHTWRGLEDAAVTLAPDVPFLLRLTVWEEGGTAASNLVQQFQVRKNAGTWQNITTTSTICKAVAVAAFANGANCTRRLTAKPTGTFEATGAGCTEDGNSGGNANDVTANGYTETEAGLQLVGTDLVQADTVEFRLTVSGPITSITYDVTPSATVGFAAQALTLPVRSSTVTLWPATVATTGVTPPSRLRLMWLGFEVPDAPTRQHGRPKRDVGKGSWTASTGTDLFEMVNEVDFSDADYVTSSASPSSDTALLELTGVNYPVVGTCSVLIRAKRL